MLIDIHVHGSRVLGPIRRSGTRYPTPTELLAMMDAAGIDRAVLLSSVSPESATCRVSPEDVLEVCAAHPNRLIPFANLDPSMVDNSPKSDFTPLLQHYKKAGCKGVGEYTPNLPFDDPLNMNVFRHVEAAGLPLTFHIAPRVGGCYGCVDELGLPRLERVLKACPHLVLLGHSQPFWAEISGDLTEDLRNTYPKGKVAPGGATVRLFREYPNLYGDLSPAAGSGCNAISRDPEFGYAFLEEFQDRLLFGTDICDPRNQLDLIFYLNEAVGAGRLSREAYEKISYGNAERLLGVQVGV
jgi:predicted TIM-barrel fold metal-dependent hydrolase